MVRTEIPVSRENDFILITSSLLSKIVAISPGQKWNR